jgi:hypothetical protein
MKQATFTKSGKPDITLRLERTAWGCKLTEIEGIETRCEIEFDDYDEATLEFGDAVAELHDLGYSQV